MEQSRHLIQMGFDVPKLKFGKIKPGMFSSSIHSDPRGLAIVLGLLRTNLHLHLKPIPGTLFNLELCSTSFPALQSSSLVMLLGVYLCEL
jgi:hypothetical protein